MLLYLSDCIQCRELQAIQLGRELAGLICGQNEVTKYDITKVDIAKGRIAKGRIA